MSPRSCVVSSTVTPRSRLICGRNSRTRCLRDDVETDRRLVEEEQLRVVQHRRGQLAADALAERELPHGRVQERVEVEHLAEAREVLAVAVGRERGRCAAAARTSRSAAGPTRAGCAGRTSTPIRRASSMRCRDGSSPATRTRPADGTRMPGQHLDRRRLAGAVRAEVAEQLAALDAEGDAVDRVDDTPLAPEAGRAGARRTCFARCSTSIIRRRSGSGGRRTARRARRRAQRRAATTGDEECERTRQAERVGLVEDVERREVADEAERDEVREEPAEPAREDVDRVLRQEVAAVGERVRELAAVGRPERRAHEPIDPDRAEDHDAAGIITTSIATRPASHVDVNAASA